MYFSTNHFSRFDPNHKLGVSTVIEKDGRPKPVGVLVAMFTPQKFGASK